LASNAEVGVQFELLETVEGPRRALENCVVSGVEKRSFMLLSGTTKLSQHDNNGTCLEPDRKELGVLCFMKNMFIVLPPLLSVVLFDYVLAALLVVVGLLLVF
jgi:hypothetical protein